MKNFKIGTRIISGFSLLILVTIALGLFALARVATIKQGSSEVSTNTLPSVIALSKIPPAVYAQLLLVNEHAQSSDKKEMANLEVQINAFKAQNDQNFALYQALPQGPEEKTMSDAVIAARSEFRASINELLPVSRLGTPQANKKAAEMAKNLKPQADKYAGLLNALVEYNDKHAISSMHDIDDSVASAARGVWIGLTLAILIAIPISIYIMRGITKPLAKAVTLVTHICSGDLSQSVQVNSTDEVGVMLAGMNTMVTNLRASRPRPPASPKATLLWSLEFFPSRTRWARPW